MARNADESQLDDVREALLDNEGETASFYANMLGIHRYLFNTVLAMLNDRGFFLSEDDNGRLWPFDPDNE